MRNNSTQRKTVMKYAKRPHFYIFESVTANQSGQGSEKLEVAGLASKKQVIAGTALVATFVLAMVAWYCLGVIPHDKIMNDAWEKNHPHKSNVTIVYPQ
ncbi:MAG: hypothetical protein V4524_00010 [Patescibacteria group bacterium]